MINDQLPYVKSGDPIKAEHINAIVKAVKMRTPRPSNTVTVRQTSNGFVMDAATSASSGSASAILPLQCVTSSRTTDNTEIVVEPGTVLGVMPTIGGTALDAGTAPTISVSNYETRYIVLNISGTPTVTTLDSRDFFHPTMSSITVTITSQNTAPTGSDLVSSTGSFKAHLATYVNGVKTAQNGYGPITGLVQDQLDGSGDGTLLLEYTD